MKSDDLECEATCFAGDDDDTIVRLTKRVRPSSRRGSSVTGVTVEQFRSQMRSQIEESSRSRPCPDELDDSDVAVFNLVRIGADVWVKVKR